MAGTADPGAEIAGLLRRLQEANSALLNGDAVRYFALASHSPDFILMTPFGGLTRDPDHSEEAVERMSRFFRGGRSDIELVQAELSGDLALLVTIEHQRVAVGGLPEQDWSLRVTQAFRREGGAWKLVHRHADPLVRGISLEQSAALARG